MSVLTTTDDEDGHDHAEEVHDPATRPSTARVSFASDWAVALDRRSLLLGSSPTPSSKLSLKVLCKKGRYEHIHRAMHAVIDRRTSLLVLLKNTSINTGFTAGCHAYNGGMNIWNRPALVDIFGSYPVSTLWWWCLKSSCVRAC
jgi:hypothetical protein